jgi:hypothetical protein
LQPSFVLGANLPHKQHTCIILGGRRQAGQIW